MKKRDTEVRSDNLRLYFILCIFLILGLSIGAAAWYKSLIAL